MSLNDEIAEFNSYVRMACNKLDNIMRYQAKGIKMPWHSFRMPVLRICRRLNLITDIMEKVPGVSEDLIVGINHFSDQLRYFFYVKNDPGRN